MTHVKGNIRGAQNKKNGPIAKRTRQETAWAQCPKHTFSVDGYMIKKSYNIMGEMIHQDKRIKKCKSCGAPEPEKD